MIKAIFSLSLFLILAACSSQEHCEQQKPAPLLADKNVSRPVRALLLTGGCCHDYEFQKKRLSEASAQRANIKWDIIHEGGKSKNYRFDIYKKRDWPKNYDVIVHNECFAKEKDDTYISQIVEDHQKAGVGVVFIHCALHTNRDGKKGTDDWNGLIGVSSKRHEHNETQLVENVAPKHPIMQGFGELWKVQKDELYIINKKAETFTPLARAFGHNTKQFHPCIWVNETKTNKVFGISMGHTNETFKDDKFIDVVTRGILWSAGKLQENGKPLAGYEAQK